MKLKLGSFRDLSYWWCRDGAGDPPAQGPLGAMGKDGIMRG